LRSLDRVPFPAEQIEFMARMATCQHQMVMFRYQL
jgi:hypothetical protein